MAEGISTRVARKLKQALGGGEVRAGVTEGTATVAATEGGVWLSIPGSDAPTPVNGNVTCDVAKGDVVGYRIEDGRLSVTGSVSKPSIGETKAAGLVEPVAEAVEELKRETENAAARTNRVVERSRVIAGIANAAQMVAEATNQHFFSDDNGVHVTQAEQEVWEQAHEGPNMLLNSIGQLFRDGLTNLISITTQAGARAITFWDGLGNSAGNITASFGADGAQIGYDPTYKTSATYFSSSGLRIKSRQGYGQHSLYDVAGIVATDGYVRDVTTLGISADWTYTLGFTPLAGSDVEVYSRGRTGGSLTLVGTFTGGTAGTIQDGGETFTYDGDVTIEHIRDPHVTTQAIAIFGYKRYSDANHPWLHIGYIDQEQTRAGNTISVGTHLLAKTENQAVFGKYNDNDPDNAFEIGNGTADNARSNAFAVDWSGNVTAAGTLNAARQESTVTADTSLITPRSGSNHVWHNGATCTVALGFNLVSNLASGGYITIGTVPEGWRPPYTVYCSVYGNSTAVGSLQAYVQAAGGIVIRNNGPSAIGTTQNVYVAATYAM